MELCACVWFVANNLPFHNAIQWNQSAKGIKPSAGLTESSIIATLTSSHDVWPGSSGSLLPNYSLRLLGPDGEDITEYDKPGEILFWAPNLFVGYLGDDQATKDTLDSDGWLHTGDVGKMKTAPSGAEHLIIVDRIKDMIKVKVRTPRFQNALLF